ncbi:hypothetical protein [Luteimonas lutimaris]|uniref:DUF2189 domain-containing protein n=1 Tax=Luteimonas lutimaris TaxID=698645 RepID=A0ABP7MLN3_9GAMM|nr:hypothetical protein [Luteimonas sp.]
MNVATQSFDAAARPAVRVLGRWLGEGWQVFRRAPVRLLLLSLLPILIEGLLQLVPLVGVAVSKLLTPLAGAWIWCLVDARVRSGRFAPKASTVRWLHRLPAALQWAVIALVVFGFQLLVAGLMGGTDAVKAMATADAAGLNLDRVQLAWVLASGVLVATPLMFVLPLVLLDEIAIDAAVVRSLRAVLAYWKPVALVTALTTAILMGLVWMPLLLLVLLPFGVTVGYAAYRDVFHDALRG